MAFLSKKWIDRRPRRAGRVDLKQFVWAGRTSLDVFNVRTALSLEERVHPIRFL